ncbi:hypothetical protein HJFPF1_06161 [Paramyrothecium foliicola]|nr:hypothetical protein HJFPF1_06161 [Paramyrothecium foliicola]
MASPLRRIQAFIYQISCAANAHFGTERDARSSLYVNAVAYSTPVSGGSAFVSKVTVIDLSLDALDQRPSEARRQSKDREQSLLPVSHHHTPSSMPGASDVKNGLVRLKER